MGSGNPFQVSRSKKLIESGQRMGEYAGEERPFYCRHCGLEMRSVMVPAGWYSLTRHTGTVFDKPHRLGAFCSLVCLARNFPRLQGIEDDLGSEWKSATDGFRPKRTDPR